MEKLLKKEDEVWNWNWPHKLTGLTPKEDDDLLVNKYVFRFGANVQTYVYVGDNLDSMTI